MEFYMTLTGTVSVFGDDVQEHVQMIQVSVE